MLFCHHSTDGERNENTYFNFLDFPTETQLTYSSTIVEEITIHGTYNTAKVMESEQNPNSQSIKPNIIIVLLYLAVFRPSYQARAYYYCTAPI